MTISAAVTRPATKVAAFIGIVTAAQFAPTLLGIPGIPRAVYGASGHRRGTRHVALTFDDGPHPQATAAVLQQLQDFRVRATFFVIGEQLQRDPDIGRAIITDGHEIGVHGWTHSAVPGRSPIRVHRDLVRTRDLITSITGTAPRWYRPPYGVPTMSALISATILGLRPVWWTRWGRDWEARADSSSISCKILGSGHRSRLGGGDTILLHDSDHYGTPGSWRATTAALPAILSGISQMGGTAGTLSDHLTSRDIPRGRSA
jgi:peptidoglycan/xylan/chitin deacetylase (PgdA/CDA1 family)